MLIWEHLSRSNSIYCLFSCILLKAWPLPHVRWKINGVHHLCLYEAVNNRDRPCWLIWLHCERIWWSVENLNLFSVFQICFDIYFHGWCKLSINIIVCTEKHKWGWLYTVFLIKDLVTLQMLVLYLSVCFCQILFLQSPSEWDIYCSRTAGDILFMQLNQHD